MVSEWGTLGGVTSYHSQSLEVSCSSNHAGAHCTAGTESHQVQAQTAHLIAEELKLW